MERPLGPASCGLRCGQVRDENGRPYELDVDTASTATIAYVIRCLRKGIRLPFGVNVLWNAMASIARAAATGADFVLEILLVPTPRTWASGSLARAAQCGIAIAWVDPTSPSSSTSRRSLRTAWTVAPFEHAVRNRGLRLQRSAQTGILTDLSYPQFVGESVANVDLELSMRHLFPRPKICDPAVLEAQARLILVALRGIGHGMAHDRDWSTA